MKTVKIILTAVFFLSLALTSCSKSDSKETTNQTITTPTETVNPPETTPPAPDTYFIKFKYNNVQYSFIPSPYTFSKKEIKGSDGINLQYKGITLSMPLSPAVGNHNVTYDDSNPDSYGGGFVSQAEALYLDGTSGTINITAITSTTIEGTFQFSGKDAAGTTITITDGSFKSRL